MFLFEEAGFFFSVTFFAAVLLATVFLVLGAAFADDFALFGAAFGAALVDLTGFDGFAVTLAVLTVGFDALFTEAFDGDDASLGMIITELFR